MKKIDDSNFILKTGKRISVYMSIIGISDSFGLYSGYDDDLCGGIKEDNYEYLTNQEKIEIANEMIFRWESLKQQSKIAIDKEIRGSEK